MSHVRSTAARPAGGSPYAVPLAALETRVAAADQTSEQAEPRTRHLPGDPALWSAAAVPSGGGGADGD